MKPTMYAALALGGLLALCSPAEARPVDVGSKAATHFTKPEIDYENEALCYDIESRRWIVREEACEDARRIASWTLSDYFRELGVRTITPGMFMKGCAPREILVPGGTAYQANVRACVSLEMYGPDLVDAVLEDVDKQERLLEGRRHAAYVHSTFEYTLESSGSSPGGPDRNITGTTNATVVEDYGVTNRSLPWIAALEKAVNEIGFDDRKRRDIWKWAAGDGKVLKRQGVKSVYEALCDVVKKRKR